MTAAYEAPIAFHFGFAVHNLVEATARFGAILSVPEWHHWERETSSFRIKVAYGRARGITIEMLEVVSGEAPTSEFLRRHGEGIQHIGMWVPDLQQAVAHAVSSGGSVTFAALQGDNRGLVGVAPGEGGMEVIDRLDARGGAFLSPGLAGVEFEFMGPTSSERLRETLGPGYKDLLVPPSPWDPGA